ncbi:unnamed protein product, partial [Angiostrongylus costaricensis]|uniref:DUF3381 domain-containing protein n=1 Tax=Angiostrongylus costaricensis TaxID=334426 RepID=A0A0R3PAU8_ANGCS
FTAEHNGLATRGCFLAEDDKGKKHHAKCDAAITLLFRFRRFEFSNDLTYLEGLKFGRMSFKGCNPEVEKLMVYYERKMKGEDSDSDYEDGKDVGDKEMAKTSMKESSGRRLNFTDIRKRGAIGTWASGDSRRKLRGDN